MNKTKIWTKIIRMTSRLNTAKEFIRITRNKVTKENAFIICGEEEIIRTYPKSILELKRSLI